MKNPSKQLHQKDQQQISIPDLLSDDIQIIDVRSPNEFSDGFISGAYNVPLLSNEERSLIGVLYKKFGQDKAIKEGYEILEPKLDHLKKWFDQLNEKNPVAVYCARGGMRSRVVSSLLTNWGFRSLQLQGGYKAYRNYVIKFLEHYKFHHLVVLHGQTGVGKTLVINKLKNSIDLEGLAQHRGSLFGAIGKKPVTQKQFETALFDEIQIKDNSRPIFVEGESRKIGNVSIPSPVFSQLLAGEVVLLEAPVEKRVERIIEEYITNQKDSGPEISEIIGKLKPELGKDAVTKLQENIARQEYGVCFKYLLEAYYDKKYIHTIKKLNVLHTIDVSKLENAVEEINKIYAMER